MQNRLARQHRTKWLLFLTQLLLVDFGLIVHIKLHLKLKVKLMCLLPMLQQLQMSQRYDLF